MAELTRKDLILLIAAIPTGGCEHPRHLIRLAGVDLSGLDLSGLNLSHADLAAANLRGCNLSDANLTGCDLSHADLTDAVLRGIYAEGARFLDARMIRVDLRSSDRDTFYGTQLIETDFEGADLTEARLCGADLSGAHFCEAILDGADFSDARVDSLTRFNKARLAGAIYNSIRWDDVAPEHRPNLTPAVSTIAQHDLGTTLSLAESAKTTSLAA